MPRKPKRRKKPQESPCAYIKRKYSYWVRMIANTKKTGLEHAYSICMPEDDIDFIVGECAGTKCSVTPVRCPAGIPRSYNHTHPGGRNYDAFSIGDIASGLVVKSPFDCLYSTGDRRGLCISYRHDLTDAEKLKVKGCRIAERQYAKRSTDKNWKPLEKCYREIPKIVAQSFCEYGLKARAKRVDYRYERIE